MKKKYTPKFKDKRFKTQAEFDKWLDETTAITLYLEDQGHDMQIMYLAKSGEVLHCDFHSSIYAGKLINLDTLVAEQPLQIWDDLKGWVEYGRLIPETIEHSQA